MEVQAPLLVRSASVTLAGRPVVGAMPVKTEATETVSETAVPDAAVPLKTNVTLPTVPREKRAALNDPVPLAEGQLEPLLGMHDQRGLVKPLMVAVMLALVAVVEPRLVTVTRKVPTPPDSE